MRLAFLGCGNVGGTLADRLKRLGHGVTLATADPASASVRKALARNPALAVAPPAEAVAAADVVFLATPYGANAEALSPVAPALAGKVLVDCTNPVGPGLTHAPGAARSGSEAVQALAPGARLVKAFSVYGFENFEDASFPGRPLLPAMFLCGDDAGAKAAVSALAADLGFEPLDTGGLVQALHLEHMTLLWVRMVRVGGASPHLAWARLSR